MLAEFSLLLRGQGMHVDDYFDSDDEETFLVGKRVKVRFSEAKWYSGTVTKHRVENDVDVLTVLYDDGELLDHPEFSSTRCFILEKSQA